MQHHIWIFILFFATILTSCSCEIWKDIFFDADLTFILTPECNGSSDLPHHHKPIVRSNPYTPQRYVILCRTKSKFRYDNELLQTFHYSYKEKSARSEAVFVSLNATMGYKCEMLLKSVTDIFRPEYIFSEKTSRHKDAACLRNHAYLLAWLK